MTESDPITVTGLADIDDMIEGLRQLADWRHAHPEIPGVMSGAFWVVAHWQIDPIVPADIVRAITDGAPVGAVTKKVGKGEIENTMFFERRFPGGVRIQYQADRERVCVRRVIGTEQVEVPDPDAPAVTIDREIVQWDCAPILGGLS